MALCKYCAAGHKPKDGDHWIVQSIVPARIKIVRCKLAKAQHPVSDTADRAQSAAPPITAQKGK